MTTPIADNYEAAAALIGTHGWIQHDYGDERKGFCALGAMYEASEFPDIGFEVSSITTLYEKLGDIGYGDSIAEWNDSPDRTQDEVIDLLVTAAAELRGNSE